MHRTDLLKIFRTGIDMLVQMMIRLSLSNRSRNVAMATISNIFIHLAGIPKNDGQMTMTLLLLVQIWPVSVH